MNGFKLYLPGRLLCRISPRFRLRAICRAIGIKPYVWQRSFALGRINSLPGKRTRGNGKTTAVMLRLLMLPDSATPQQAEKILACDPDWLNRSNSITCYKFWNTYNRLRVVCCCSLVPVPYILRSVFFNVYK